MTPCPIAIVIPTKGRPQVLADTLASLERQTLKADQIILSATCLDDLPPVEWQRNIQVVLGPAGLCRQRNAARSNLDPSMRLVFLLDDDLELANDYLERMVEAFQSEPTVALLGGNLIAEGIPRIDAIQLLAARQGCRSPQMRTSRALYGCNMCVRAEVFRQVEFDENLRLVGWLEDFDWSVRAGCFGRIMAFDGAEVVHLKVNVGRASGYRFGYAQVMNPYYLHKKGTIQDFSEVLKRHWLRLVASNVSGFARKDNQVDRWGRLRGNLRAFVDILRGRPDPSRIEMLD